MDTPTYANVTRVAVASGIVSTPAAERGILTHLDTASRHIESLCGGRRFYPVRETRTFDWPDPTGGTRGERLWLDDNELAGPPTAITVAGAAFTAYKLRPHDAPARYGRPYRWIEPDFDTTAFFSPFSSGSAGPQDAISITGPFGYSETLTETTALAGAVSSTTATTITIADSTRIAAGDAIQIGSEYLIVTASAFTSTGDTLAADLAVDATDDAIAVADGTAYTEGELLRIDRERMEIDEINGNTLYVRRSTRSRIAAHTTGTSIQAPRQLTVTRGALGTTAATHTDTTAVYRLSYPPHVEQLTVALTLVALANERAGWARTVGEGEGEREMSTRNLDKLEATVRRKYGQRARVRAAGGMP